MPVLLKYPTTTTTTNGSGISGQWANPANIFADDGLNATAAYLSPPAYTFDLTGAGFGMWQNLGSSDSLVFQG